LESRDKVQIWWADNMPVRYPTAKEIAEELFVAMRKQPMCAGKWIPAVCIERVICPTVCRNLGWPERPWLGRDGVAFHFARLSPRSPRYIRIEVDGMRQNLQHYFVPHPAEVAQLAPCRRRMA
jgi:hypothetical protein